MPAPAPAINQQVAWKNPEMRGFALALIRAALAAGEEEFTTDIVPEETRSNMASNGTPGHGIAGSVCTILKDAHVIEPVGMFNNKIFYQARRASERANAKGRWLNVYKLKSREIAAAFLKANTPAATQPALDLK